MTGHFIEFEKEEINLSIPDRFEQQVLRYPDRIAVRTSKISLSYAELNRVANGIARLIISRGDEGGEPVSLILEQGALLIAAILGVLKAGKPYVPLDPSFASDRLAHIREDSCATLILTDNKNFSLAGVLAGSSPVVNIDDISSQFSSENPGLSISSDSTAYILYTSGSTGQPKGVFQNHRNVLHNIMKYTNGLHISPEDRLTLLYSCSFGASVSDIYGALLNGAGLFPFNLKEKGLHQLADWLMKEDITIYHSVPTVFRHFVSALKGHERFPKLRIIKLGGEPVYRNDWDLYKKHFNEKCIFHVGLGSTEMNIIRQFFCDHQTALSSNIVPVGYEVQDTEVVLLNENREEVGYDSEGEIAIRSQYLPPGYWRRPELTNALFLPDPKGGKERIYLTGDRGCMGRDGCLTILGRKDTQLKVRGYRVEPAEVEMALMELDGVHETVVAGLENIKGDKHLVAYVVMQDGTVCTISELRRSLKQKLPDYMMPSDIVLMASLPLTPNGKIDRKSLPKPERKRPELDTVFIAPRDELETLIANICEEILDIHPVGVKDDLSDLGVDSTLYFNLLLEIEKKCGTSLPLDTFPRATTVEDLSNVFHTEEMPALFAAPVRSKSGNSASAGHVYSTSKKKPKSAKSVLFNACIIILPYAAGIKFLSWFCAQQWAHRIFFRKHVHRLRQVLSCIKSPNKKTDVIRISLLANFFQHWIYGALARTSPQEFDRWVTVKGRATLQSSHRKNRGVVLVLSHLALEHLTRLMLDRRGFDDILIFAAGLNPEIPKILGLTRSKQIVLGLKNDDRFFIRHLAAAKKVLDQGGIVLIAGDGRQGDSGINIPFHGRLLSFKAGFAELAINSGADAIPAFVSIDTAGHIDVKFLDPLNKDLPETGHKEKVEFLIRRYVDLLEKNWTDDPGNIRFGRLSRFLSSPEA